MKVIVTVLGLFMMLYSPIEYKATKALSKFYQRDVTIIDTGREDLDGRLYYISECKDKVFIGKGRSKFETFDYMVLLDNNNTIKNVKVLVYREHYGAEIASKRWLRQWIGVNKPKPFVSAISGATISVHAIKQSINNVLNKL